MSTVCLFSGGLDSAGCVAYAQRFLPKPTVPLYVHYGSVHESAESTAAQMLAERLGLQLQSASIEYPNAVHSPLLRAHPDDNQRIKEGNLCIVPMRNALLLGLAASLAYSLGGSHIVYGAHLADSLGYPDCRAGFVNAMQDVLFWSLERIFTIEAPLLYPERTVNTLEQYGFSTKRIRQLLTADVPEDVKGKTLSLLLLHELGYEWVIPHTHSCYAGQQGGCGECATCRLRIKAEQLYEKLIA